MFKLFRNILYIENSLEHFIFIKVDRAKIHNAMLQDYRVCQVYQLRYYYDCFRRVQQILKCASSNGPHHWNTRAVEQLEEDADWNSSVGK